MLESLFNKVADPEACFPVNFAKIVYRTALVAATDHSGLYNFASNSNGTSFVKENYRLYFSMNLTNFVPKSHCRAVKFSFKLFYRSHTV